MISKATFLLASLVLAGSIWLTQGPEVDAADPHLRLEQGRLLCHGQPFTGAVVAYYPDGKLRERLGYSQGWREGRSRTYYPGGVLESERYFHKDQKEGLHRGWWENGKPKFLYHFRHGQFEGTRQDWYRGGQLCQNMNYRQGREVGEQTILQMDGRFHSHYVVAEDGRRYGLINSRTCRQGAQ